MTEHITIPIDKDEIGLARLAAEALGVDTEVHLRTLIAAHLPAAGALDTQRFYLSKIFGMGSSAEPTDIARDKDKLIGEAVWQEHFEELKQT